MKIFVIGLPHSLTVDPFVDDRFTTCAFTTRVYGICKAMYERGHEVIHVGVGGSNVPCSKSIDVVSFDQWDSLYGDKKRADFHKDSTGSGFSSYLSKYREGIKNTILEASPYTSVVCANLSLYHANALKDVPQFVSETCIGYQYHCIWSKYRVFDSYAWMHGYYASLDKSPTGQWYDRVIPPGFDTSKFEYQEKKDDYFLITCRLLECKGVHIAAELAKKMGFKLKIAGPGDPKPYLIAPNIEYLGVLGPKDRNEVMGKARALFSPTIYVEPFGMVVVEANLCGTPVITTDFGGFVDNVNNGVSGFRCHNWAEFKKAVNDVDKLNPQDCRKWGENFSYDKIAVMYENYFQTLLDLNGKGWYEDRPTSFIKTNTI